MNWEHATEGLIALLLIVFEWTCQVKNTDFTKILPLTYHTCVKCLPRVKKLATNREQSSRAIRWSLLLSSTMLSLETRKGGGAGRKYFHDQVPYRKISNHKI